MNDILDYIKVLENEPIYETLLGYVKQLFSENNYFKFCYYSGCISGILLVYVKNGIFSNRDYVFVTDMIKFVLNSGIENNRFVKS
ncbi:MAG: hypothetical protein IAA25_07280 [Candidatus Ruminococcus intestinipullorum]|nr:hypothetical protein [Candidatus Ruminococcus intestinipullorum]